jgi:ATP phosphoribosyltransferase
LQHARLTILWGCHYAGSTSICDWHRELPHCSTLACPRSYPDAVNLSPAASDQVSLVFLPAHDIATYVSEGNVDMGITGQDVIAETEPDCENLETVVELGFGKCKLAVQGPVSENITDVSTLAGKRIVTSFPVVTEKFFKQFETEATGTTKIKFVSGSVEAACQLGLADGIVDLVETGTTMRAAGLEIVEKIMDTQAVLVKNKKSLHPEMISTLTRRIHGHFTAQKYQMIQYNIKREALQKAIQITPGKRSPTITNLEDKDWVSVSALVLKKDTPTIADQLEEIGADSILIFAIQNTRM